MAKSKASRKAAPESPEDHPLLERLKEIAAASGLEVREERLHREVGYQVRSGLCRVEGREVLLLDKNATAGERVEVLLAVLAGRDLGGVFIEPELRTRIGGQALAGEESGETTDAARAHSA